MALRTLRMGEARVRFSLGPMNFPKHIAIIPDGNRRWAKKKGLLSFLGHSKGSEIAEEIIKEAVNLKIPFITFWGCSINNIVKRPKSEVNFLFKIFEKQFKKLLEDKAIYENKIKVNVFGRWKELFPPKIISVIDEIIEKTKNHRNYQLTFLLAYSGKDEMTTAIKKIAELRIKPCLPAGRNSELRIDEKLIKENLWTKDFPPVDLAIRTGEENDNWAHWSDGFMMWDAANSQFYFTKTLWPDFNKKEFKKAIDKFSLTEKRLGK